MKFLLGIAVGLFIGLAYAPAPGEQTRERLVKKAREYSDMPQQKVSEMVEQSKKKVSDTGARLGREAADKAMDKVTEKLGGGEKSA